jgi:hypothetical protein
VRESAKRREFASREYQIGNSSHDQLPNAESRLGVVAVGRRGTLGSKCRGKKALKGG